jgi:hypothetical protein
MRVCITRKGLDVSVEVPDEVLPALLKVCGLLSPVKSLEKTTYKCVGVNLVIPETYSGKIRAIRILRTLSDIGLTEAKEVVESISAENPWIYNPSAVVPYEDVDRLFNAQTFLNDNWGVLIWDGPVPPCPRLGLTSL